MVGFDDVGLFRAGFMEGIELSVDMESERRPWWEVLLCVVVPLMFFGVVGWLLFEGVVQLVRWLTSQ